MLRRFNLWMIVFAGLALVVLPAAAQSTRPATTTPSTAPSDVDLARVKQIIEQLDNSKFSVRHAASLRLNSLDGKYCPLVEAACQQSDISPESRQRLENALFYLRPRSRIEPANELRAAWVSKSLHAAYDPSGPKNPQRDEMVHRGIDLMIQLGLDPLHGSRTLREQAMKVFGGAINAGCKDPLIESLQGMCVGRIAGGASSYGLGGGLEGTQAEVQRGDYPLFAKIYVSLGYLFVAEHILPTDAAMPGELLKKLAAEPGARLNSIRCG